MKVNSNKIRRIDKPDDLRFKRQVLFAGCEIHGFYNMPGRFISPGVNELPTLLNQHSRTDATFIVNIDGEKNLFSVEDESIIVDENAINKSYKYNKILSDFFKGNVVSYIVTPQPLNKCCKLICPCENVFFKPNLISLTSNYNGEEVLNTLTNRILKQGCVLSKKEALTIVMLPRMFQENHEEILEKACLLLKKVKIEDMKFKSELILEMQCTIHKYAKTDEDILRLEEVIGMHKIEGISDYPDNWHLDEFYNMGYSKGLSEGESNGFSNGELSMALKIKEALGIDEAVRISGLSKDTIENYHNGK